MSKLFLFVVDRLPPCFLPRGRDRVDCSSQPMTSVPKEGPLLPSRCSKRAERTFLSSRYRTNFSKTARFSVGPSMRGLFLAQIVEKLMVEVIPFLVGVVVVCKLDYFVSAFPEKGAQLFVLDYLSSCKTRFPINEDESWSRLSDEIEVGSRNGNFDLCLVLDSRGF